MEEKSKLNLIFLSFIAGGTKFHSYELSFESKNKHIIHDLEESYEIPEKVFQYGKDKAIIYIILYDSIGNKLKTIKYPVFYHSTNRIYIEQKYIKSGYNFEIDFKNSNNLMVNICDREFEIFDNIGTKDRQKITFINFGITEINVNQKNINFLSEIERCSVKSSINFYRLSINMEDPELKIIVQPVEETKARKIDSLNDSKDVLDELYTKLEELLVVNDSKLYEEQYESISEEFYSKIPDVSYELNKPKNYLEQYFKEHSIDFNIILKYEIIFLFRDGKTIFSKNKELFEKIVDRMKQFYAKIKEDVNIQIYDKIGLLSKITSAFLLCENMKDLEQINLFYIITSNCAEKSIMNKTKIMFDDFISKISDESKIFFYLLNLDSGIGYYNNQAVYTFDMSNLNMIKNHLKELFPRIILFYDYDNENLGNTNKTSGCVAINVHRFTLIDENHENIIFDQEIEDEDFSDFMAINIFIILLHEFGGHKKIAYNKNNNEESSSPKKIINEKNKLVELKRYSSYKNDDNEYILSSDNSEEGEGESGKYLELCFGKYGKDLISTLLLLIKDKGKLLNHVDLFVDGKLDILQKYVILKTEVENNNIKINISKNLTIEEEIKELEKIIEKSNFHTMIGKKRKREKDISTKKNYEGAKKSEEKNMKINVSLNINKKNELELEEEDKKRKDIEENNDKEKIYEKENLKIVESNVRKTRYQRLKEQIRRKYQYKNKREMIAGIKKKIKEKSVSIDEYCDFCYVLRYSNCKD